MKSIRRLVTFCLGAALFVGAVSQAAEKHLLWVTNSDEGGKEALYKARVTIIEDAQENLYAIRILSEPDRKGQHQIDRTYKYTELTRMENSAVRIAGAKAMTIGGKRLTPRGGVLHFTYERDAINPFSDDTGEIDVEIEQVGGVWHAYSNGVAGRVEIREMHLAVRSLGNYVIGINDIALR